MRSRHYCSEDRSSWLRTPAGELAALRVRSRRRFEVFWRGEPTGKGSLRDTEREAFRTAVSRAFAEFARGAFRGPVALRLTFGVTGPNPPEVHTLAKNHLDLLYPTGVRDPAPLPLRDDGQIEFLSLGYDLGAPPGVRLVIRPMRDFIADIQLHGTWATDFDAAWTVDRDYGDEVDALLEWRRQSAYHTPRMGTDGFAALERVLTVAAQNARLRATTRWQWRVLESLRRTRLASVGPAGRPEWMADFARSIADAERQLLLSPPMVVALGSLRRIKGESARFDTELRSRLTELRTNDPIMHPLLTSVGLFLIVVSPNWRGFDLDNVAGRVLPAVHQILQPPAVPDAFVRAADIADPEHRREWERYESLRRRWPRSHVTRCDVLRLRSVGPADAITLSSVITSGEDDTDLVGHMDRNLDRWTSRVRDHETA